MRTYLCKQWDNFILDTMNDLNKSYGWDLNCCFVNGYNDEKDSLGWHSDDSPEMSHDQPIISLSLGATRNIMTRDLETKEINTYPLENGSIFVMPKGFQLTHEHKIPKGSQPCGPRISLTYRSMINI